MNKIIIVTIEKGLLGLIAVLTVIVKQEDS